MIIQASSEFRLDGVVDEDGSFAESRFRVDVDPASSDSRFAVETISSAPLGLEGAQTLPQEAWLRLTHGSSTFYDGYFPEIEVSLAADGIEWRVQSHGYEGDERSQNETEAWHGRAIDRGAAPPGSDSIDLDLQVRFDSDVAENYKIITTGRSWQSDEPLTDFGPAQIAGSGYLSRFEGVLGTYSLQPGSEVYHGEVIRELLRLAGIDNSRIGISSRWGSVLNGALELVCADMVAEARTIADAGGGVLTEDADGNIVVRDIAPVDEAAVAEINIERLETGEIAARIAANTRDVPMCWSVEGQRPEPTQETDGEVSDTVRESQTRALYAKPQATRQQNNLGVVSPTGLAANLTAIETVVGEVWVTRTYRDGCLVRVKRVTWGWYVPEVHRYASYATADGTDTGAGGVYKYNSQTVYFYDDSVVANDSIPAYAWPRPLFVPIKVEMSEYVRDGLVKGRTYTPQEERGEAIGWKGRLKRGVNSVGEWFMAAAPYKVRTTSSETWESRLWLSDVKLRGNGDPVADDELWFSGPESPDADGGTLPSQLTNVGETYGISDLVSKALNRWISQEEIENDLLGSEADVWANTTEIESLRGTAGYTDEQLDRALEYLNKSPLGSVHTDVHIYPYPADGWITRTVLSQQSWARRDPPSDGIYLYQSGESDDATIIGRVVRTETTSFVSQGDTHDALVINRDENGRLLPSESTFGVQGYLPVAEICIPEIRDRSETVPVRGQWCLDSATDDFTPRYQSDSYSFGVESEAQAAELARKKLRDRSALVATISLPINAIFRPKSPVIFRALHKGIDPDNYDHASNAWVDTSTIRVARSQGLARKTVVLTLKVPVI